MADRPIIFSAPMIRALLEGRKTQTRRVLKPQIGDLDNVFCDGGGFWHVTDSRGAWMSQISIPHAPGDRRWVKEALVAESTDQDARWPGYEADGKDVYPMVPWGWKRDRLSSMFCPRWASRLTLTVTDVRVQRLQDISEADAVAEGIDPLFSDDEIARYPEFGGREPYWTNYLWHGRHDARRSWIDAWPRQFSGYRDPREAFASLWASLHGPDAWAANPWVCAMTFTVQRGNIDQPEATP